MILEVVRGNTGTHSTMLILNWDCCTFSAELARYAIKGKTMIDTLKKNYFWDFGGLNNIPSRVHIRIVHETGKPLVVICSQPLYGAGTSVQNAYNIVKRHLMPIFEMRLGYKVSSSSGDEKFSLINEIRKSRKVNTGIANWALGRLSNKLTREIFHKYRLRPDLDVVWLEHWPTGTDPFKGPPDDYLLIRENNTGESLHLKVNAKEFVKLLRYNPNDIMKPKEIFERDPYITMARSSNSGFIPHHLPSLSNHGTLASGIESPQ